MRTKLSNFNGHPKFNCLLSRPERYQDLTPQLPHCIARGSGLSYSDAALNEEGSIISTTRLNRIIKFDAKEGILIAESGATLREICEIIVPNGWFLPVVPGSASVSLGGAIAADVHGKNHLHVGSFSQHLLWLDLITANNQCMRCSLEENSALFLTTVGGMGLTGLIGSACLKLQRMPTSSMLVQTKTAADLDHVLALLYEQSATDEYCVAWINGASRKMPGVIMSAHHALAHEIGNKKIKQRSQKMAIPFKPPIKLINSFSVYFFNQFYYFSKKISRTKRYLSYQDYFYPLDKIKNWPLLYGKKGFIQYQCVFPIDDAVSGIHSLLKFFREKKVFCGLIVLKRLGSANQAPLSFATDGITIAIDIPFSKKILPILDQADDIILEHHGRIYLAKDTRLTKPKFYKMYPRCLAWLSIKKQIDPDNIFQSGLSKRLLS